MKINKTILFGTAIMGTALLSGCGNTSANLGRIMYGEDFDTNGYYRDRNGNVYGYDNGYGYDYDTGYSGIWNDGIYHKNDEYYGEIDGYGYGVGGYGNGNGVYNDGNKNNTGYNGGVSGTLYGDDSGFSTYRTDFASADL
ncbi:MAG: hypothetical protein HFE62_01935 [Firmicutes bacterium]|nr:hypothetical protein [Bacillota bacterium]